MRKLLTAVAGLLVASSCLFGCQAREEATVPAQGVVRSAVMTADSAMKETVLVADPAGAIDEIYSELDSQPKLTEITPDSLEGVLGISTNQVVSFVGYVSDPRGGLCDLVIIEPAAGQTDAVREALFQYGVQRADSFKNYDILNAYAIASGTNVYNQGEYVVMLMLPDNEAAAEIIDRYMPQ